MRLHSFMIFFLSSFTVAVNHASMLLSGGTFAPSRDVMTGQYSQFIGQGTNFQIDLLWILQSLIIVGEVIS